MQSSSHQTQYRWIMVYECILTKFCVSRLMASKTAAEATFQLLYIFLPFGPSSILSSDKFSEFTAEVICELKDIYGLHYT